MEPLSALRPRSAPLADVAQCKLSVAVSLRPEELKPEDEVELDKMVVETIKLDGRSETNLKTPDKKDTQGDHTIADALVKKYQKVMVREAPIPHVLCFYQNLLNEVICENEPLAAVDNRASTAVEKAGEGKKTAESMGKNEVMPEREMRKGLVKLITEYNDAYASGITATQGVGTGGHGEAAGMRELTKIIANAKESDMGEIGDLEFLESGAFRHTYTLIDLLSAQKVEEDIARKIGTDQDSIYTSIGPDRIIVNRFLSMLYEMWGYKTDDWNQQHHRRFSMMNDLGEYVYDQRMEEATNLDLGELWEWIVFKTVARQHEDIYDMLSRMTTNWYQFWTIWKQFGMQQNLDPNFQTYLEEFLEWLKKSRDELKAQTKENCIQVQHFFCSMFGPEFGNPLRYVKMAIEEACSIINNPAYQIIGIGKFAEDMNACFSSHFHVFQLILNTMKQALRNKKS